MRDCVEVTPPADASHTEALASQTSGCDSASAMPLLCQKLGWTAEHPETVVERAVTHIERMQKRSLQMNLQRRRIIGDITGVTGSAFSLPA